MRCSGTTTTPDTNLYLLLSGTVLREKTDTNSQASGSDLRRSGANRFARPFGDFVLHWIDGGKRDRLRPRRDLGPPFPPSGAASHYGGQKKKERKRHPPGKSESIIIKSSFVLFSKRHPASVVVSSLDGIITRYCDHQVCAPSRSDALSLYI